MAQRIRFRKVAALVLVACVGLLTPAGRSLAAHYGYRSLRQGSRGEDVWYLQSLLNRLGYLNVNPTGYYGPLTSRSVRRLQEAFGARPTGVVDGGMLRLTALMIAALEWAENGYTVKPGESLDDISRAFGIPPQVLLKMNGLDESARVLPGDRIKIPVPEFEMYEVRRGDTLSRIAGRYGVSVDDLARWNGLRPPYVIRPGDYIVVVGPFEEKFDGS